MKFFHISDVLLGEGTGKNGSKREQEENWDSFYEVMDTADREKVDLILISGNLFYRQPEKRELFALSDRFGRLKTARVVIIAGARDPITEDSAYADFTWPNNVSFFRKDHLSYMYLEDIGTIVYGMSYTHSVITDPVYDNLLPIRQLRDGTPIPDNTFHILLAFGGDGRNIPIDFSRLRTAGFDYVALGGRMNPWMDKKAPIAYAGSLCAPKGADSSKHGYIRGSADEDGTSIYLVPVYGDRKDDSITEQVIIPAARGMVEEDVINRRIKELEYENSGTGVRNAAIAFPFFALALCVLAGANLLNLQPLVKYIVAGALALVGIVVAISLGRKRGRKKKEIKALKEKLNR